MKKIMMLAMGLTALAGITFAQEDGFVSLFDGKTLNGWVKNGGSATYRVDDGTIVGTCTPNTPHNTFLCTEKEYGNFILKVDFKFDVGGNSGIQVRSACRAPNKAGVRTVYGYQAELTPDPNGPTARIYDEGRRGFQHKLVWLDPNTPQDRIKAAQATYKRNDWNTIEVQCVGPSLRTWLNGKPVADIFDDVCMKGFIGLQVHAGKQGTIRWKNIRIKDLGESQWKPFFVKGADGKTTLDGAHFVLPEDWSFQTADGGYLRGIHNSGERRDGLVVSDKNYDNFIVRVSYQLFGGNSALYFRAHEVNTPWLLRGFQNEIAGNSKDSALWHTAGDKTPGRGWVATNDEWIAKFRKAKGWNRTFTAALGDRLYNRLNGFETVDIIDPKCEKSGKVALQLHGGAKNELRFKDFEIMEITPEMAKLIQR